MSIRLWWNRLKAFVLMGVWDEKSLNFECDAGYACNWVHPYGFVSETGCPIHDGLDSERGRGD